MAYSHSSIYDNPDQPRKKVDEESEDLFQFGEGISAGYDTTMGTLGGVLSLFNTLTGDDEDALEYLQYAQQKFQDASESGGTVTSIEDIDGAADYIRWGSYSLGTILPSIATSVLGGGVGGAVAQTAAKKMIKDRVSKEVSDAVQDKVSAKVKDRLIRETLEASTKTARGVGTGVGAFGSSAAQNTGATFVDIYEETGIKAPDVALAAGVASGALDAITPLKILSKVMPSTTFTKFKDVMSDKIVQNGGVARRALIEGAKQAGVEGFAEMTQELIQATAVGMMKNDPNGGFGEYFEEFSKNLTDRDEQLNNRLLNSFFVGALGGSATGAASGVFSKPRKEVEDPRRDEKLDPIREEFEGIPDEEAQQIFDDRQFINEQAGQADTDSETSPEVEAARQRRESTVREKNTGRQEQVGPEAPLEVRQDVLNQRRRDAAGRAQSELDAQNQEPEVNQEKTPESSRQRQQQARENAQNLRTSDRERVTPEQRLAEIRQREQEQRQQNNDQKFGESLGRIRKAKSLLVQLIPDSLYETGDATPEENSAAAEQADRTTVIPSGPTIELGRSMESLEGKTVEYLGATGVLIRKEDGIYYVATPEEDVLIERGESQQGVTSAALLGVKPVDIDIDTPEQEISYNPEDRTFVARRKTYKYISTKRNEDGEAVAIEAETLNGETRTFRSAKTVKAMEAAQAKLQSEAVKSGLANGEAQFDELPIAVQVAVHKQREQQGQDTTEESVTEQEVAAAVEAAPEQDRDKLRLETQALFARGMQSETPIEKSFEDGDQWREFEGSVVSSNESTLEERQAQLDVLSGQTLKQSNGDDVITLPSAGLEDIASRIATAMQRPLQFTDEGKAMEVDPASSLLSMGGDTAAAIEDVKHAVFDLINNGMPAEFMQYLQNFAAHSSQQLPSSDGAATRKGISLDMGVIGNARTESGRKELRWILAHEGWHVVDLNLDISSSLPSFTTEIVFSAEGPTLVAGDVVSEVYENYINQTELGRVFTYPFNELAAKVQKGGVDADELAKTIRQEVFAQLGAIYLSNPRLLKSQAPQAYEVMRTIRDNPQLEIGEQNGDIQNRETPVQPEGTGVQGQVRPRPVSGRDEVEEDGGVGGDSGDGIVEGQADQGVDGAPQQEAGDSDRRVLRPEELTIKRAEDFATSGDYDVTFPDGSVEKIFRDTEQFSSPVWHWVGAPDQSVESTLGIGSTRNEAIQRLIVLKEYDLPKADDALFIRGPSGRAFQGVPANATLGGEDRVQTSLPNGTRGGEKYYTQGAPENHSVGTELILSDTAKVPLKDKLKGAIEGYDFFSPSRTDLTSEETIAEFQQHMVDNLIWLHDQMNPELREEAKQWYDGARKQTDLWAERYGLEPRQVAAVIANLSPQKDWFMNMSLAERMMDIHSYRQDFVADKDMNSAFARIVLKDEKGRLKQVSKMDKKAKAAFKLQQSIWNSIKDKSLADVEQALSPDRVNLGQAIWIRMYDEAKHSRNFRVMAPSGEIMGLSMGKEGPQKVAWGSFTEIMKGVKVLRDGSLESVSLSLGDAHKVRNFYNNIVAPKSELGEVTIDTHAVAAAVFKPLSAKGYEVSHAFGSTPPTGTLGIPDGVKRAGAGSSAKIGSGGTYGIVADAYREAAEQLGILPRQLQSITWEEIRVIFPASFKDEKGKNLGIINENWTAYANGELSISEVREKAYETAGTKGNKPVWADRSNVGTDEERGDGTYSRDVYSSGLPRSGDRGRNVRPRSDVDASTGTAARGGVTSTVDVGKPNTKVRPSVQRAYAALQSGEITRQEYDEAVLETIRPYEQVPTPATNEEMSGALAANKRDKIGTPIKDGEEVGLRLDIPSYETAGVWVPTLHRVKQPTSHRATAAITGADFTKVNQNKSLKVMEGGSKSPFAQIKGSFVNRTDAENVRLAKQYLNDPEWRQVGFDPRRHSTFYDRRTGEPIAMADEVVQVGPLVLAKNATTLGADEVLFSRRLGGQTQTYEEAVETGELLNGEPSSTEFTLDDETRNEKFLIKMQDKYLVLKKFEKMAAEQLGLAELPKKLRTYDAETLHSGKIKNDFDKLEDEYAKPIGGLLRDNEITIDEIGSFLIAKHARERNEYIASINPEMQDGGSGMTNAQADEHLAAVDNRESMEEIASLVYKMLEDQRNRLVEFGLIDEETADSYRSNYKFYVPLKGFAAQEDGAGGYTGPRGLPKGFSVGGKEFMSALGRSSKSDNPLLFALSDVENKIVRSRRNEVAQKFLGLADKITEAGSDQMVVYRDPESYPNIRKLDRTVKAVKMNVMNMREEMLSDGKTKRFMSVKEGGKEVFIEIKNESLARAMHNVGAENFENISNVMGKAVGAMSTFQNFRRNMLINYNPSWFFINPIRDLQTGLMYSLAEESKAGGLIEGENLTADILAGYFPAGRAYFKNLRGGKTDTELDDLFEEYQESGAPTGMTLTRDIDEQKERLASIITSGNLKSNLRAVGDLVEDFNTASENVIRFATYVAATKAGADKDKAALLAKNLTVNFNRKGELSAGLNLFYLFFNAAVQGTVNIAQAMSGRTASGGLNKAQMGAVGISLISYLVTEHNLMNSDEDDDGESLYNDLSSYDKLMSWNISNSDGKTFTQIPLPYGYGLFHTLGRLGAEMAHEVIDPMDVAAEITSATAHHLLPPPLGFVGAIGTEDDLMDFTQRAAADLLPDVVEPIAALGFNKNHFGSPIYLEQNMLMDSRPDSSKSKRSTEQFYKDTAEFLNQATGGSLFRKGGVDLSPDAMKYMVEYATGGLGRFVSRSSDVTYRLMNETTGDEVLRGDYPILRYFNGEPSKFNDKMEYYENIRAAQEVFNEAEAVTDENKDSFKRRFGKTAALEPLYKSVQKQLRALRKTKKQIEKAQVDPTLAYEKITKLEEQMDLLYDKFNQRYREASK